MKKIAIIFLAALLAACSNTSKRKKIIPNYEAEYHFFASHPVINREGKRISREYFHVTIPSSLNKELKDYLKKHSKKFRLVLRLFVSPEGKLDYIKFFTEPDFMLNNKAIENDIVDIISKHKLPTFKDNGRSIKSAYDVTVADDNFNRNDYFVAVESMPQIIGGVAALAKNIKYPEQAKVQGIEGRVFVKAYVDEKGNVKKAEIIKGIGYGCDEAALQAVRKLHFVPGTQRGKPVKVQVAIPVTFKLK